MSRRWGPGLAAGAVAGALDVALIAIADPAAGGWVQLQSWLFWAGTGGVVTATRTGLPAPLHGVAVCVLLNLPWYVQFGPAAGHPEHLPPLFAMSVLFGLALGWVGGRFR